MAALAMIDEPSWRTRHTSIYGESLRQEVLKKHIVITYVTTDLQLADPLTKPTSTKINVHLLPLLGLITCITSPPWHFKRKEKKVLGQSHFIQLQTF